MTKKTKIIAGSIAGFFLLAYLTRKPIKRMATKFISDIEKKNFVNAVYPTAKAIGNKIGVPPLFIVAQVVLESRWGASGLAVEGNNFGGIKASAGQPYVEFWTTEVKNGVPYKIKAKFAKFPTMQAGLNAQAVVYSNRYFKQYLNRTTDPITYANLLQSGKPKYATQPDYVNRIAKTLQEVKRLLT